MSPKAMRRYRPDVILCARCRQRIWPSQEATMRGPGVYHPICAPAASR